MLDAVQSLTEQLRAASQQRDELSAQAERLRDQLRQAEAKLHSAGSHRAQSVPDMAAREEVSKLQMEVVSLKHEASAAWKGGTTTSGRGSVGGSGSPRPQVQWGRLVRMRVLMPPLMPLQAETWKSRHNEASAARDEALHLGEELSARLADLERQCRQLQGETQQLLAEKASRCSPAAAQASAVDPAAAACAGGPCGAAQHQHPYTLLAGGGRGLGHRPGQRRWCRPAPAFGDRGGDRRDGRGDPSQ